MGENIKDIIFGGEITGQDLSKQYSNLGFQATHLAKAISLLKEMGEKEATKFLAFTSNLVASGLRGAIVELIKQDYVDVIITAGGAIDHDIIRSEKPYLLGSFSENDTKLHQQEVNRIGNILVPNDRYVWFESWLQPKLKQMYDAGEKIISPSQLISHLSKEINDKQSILYWCNKKQIPIYSPGIIDAAIGLQLYFFKQDHPDFIIDVAADLPKLGNHVLTAEKTGALVLGGGISKHHLLGVNLLRGGLDYSVYVSTAQEFDGSLSGAPPREAQSWGKIQENGRIVSINCDASIALPLIIAGLD